MGIFETIFNKTKTKQAEVNDYFKVLNGYTPVFSDYEGGIYEMELTRSAIHSFATACAKLKPEIEGVAYKSLEKTLQFKPNPFMDTYKFIYRLATILSVNNNAFIVPIEDAQGYIIGYYPLLPQNCEVLDVGGKPYLRYTFSNGQRAAIEYEKVGVLTQFQYKNDFFGEDNSVLKSTMKLIHAQNQGIINGVKNSANIRFLARIPLTLNPKDLAKERAAFTKENLSQDNDSGVLLFDGKYDDVKPIESKPIIVNPSQIEVIKKNVYDYFGTNENILQNKYNENEWNAYYEGKIEPFAVQLSLVMSNMTYSMRELACGNMIIFTANRMQYASNATKLSVSQTLFDRGLLTRNQVMDIWNMSRVEDGDKYYIRKEYAEVNNLDSVTDEEPKEGEIL